MFNAGIVPMEDPKMDVRKALENVSEEEARVLKRKFRKLWRKLEKAEKKPAQLGPDGKPLASKQPSRAEKLRRKQQVSRMFWEQQITPMLQRFKNLEDTRKKGEEVGS
jgi:bisphosphoglycerate-dependent phosphoglycerate mutase